VRLAQRVPVRVKLDDVPDSVALVLGRTATVAVTPAATERTTGLQLPFLAAALGGLAPRPREQKQ
jgi:multidrug resistance efflux pump